MIAICGRGQKSDASFVHLSFFSTDKGPSFSLRAIVRLFAKSWLFGGWIAAGKMERERERDKGEREEEAFFSHYSTSIFKGAISGISRSSLTLIYLDFQFKQIRAAVRAPPRNSPFKREREIFLFCATMASPEWARTVADKSHNQKYSPFPDWRNSGECISGYLFDWASWFVVRFSPKGIERSRHVGDIIVILHGTMPPFFSPMVSLIETVWPLRFVIPSIARLWFGKELKAPEVFSNLFLHASLSRLSSFQSFKCEIVLV